MKYPFWNYLDVNQMGYGVSPELLDDSDGAESLRRYRDGALCPVVIGQQLEGCDRRGAFPHPVSYKVVGKL